jgi:thiamine transport system permease protein
LVSITKFLDKLSSSRHIRIIVYATSILFFFGLILLPPILGIISKGGTISQILNDSATLSRANSAIVNSFMLAFIVSTIDLLLGVPMAWFIVRGRSRWLGLLDSIVNIPFIVPTSALGYSLLLFWSQPGGISSLFGQSLLTPGWVLVGLLHFAFSYPVIVRVMVGEIMEYDMTYDVAARTLGAPPFTVARTVSLPILKSGQVASFLLAFSRSLSETGATFLVAGAFENGPVFIQNEIVQYGKAASIGSLVYVSAILIIFSILIFAAIRILAPRVKLPLARVWPSSERKLSSEKTRKSRDLSSTLIFLLIIAVPSLFVAIPSFGAVLDGTLSQAVEGVGVWGGYWSSLVTSYVVAAIVTLIVMISGLPMAVLIARKRAGPVLSSFLDALVNVPIIVPSVALGVSLPLFWSAVGVTPGGDFGLIIFAHLCITYPYFVRSAIAAMENINPELEVAARTLGGRPLTSFRKITLPLMKYSMLAGSIMVFTRSVAETGATTALTTSLKTVPVLIVSWVKGTLPATTSDIGLGCGILILLSVILLLVLAKLVKTKKRI